jgi:hypothetical protein
MTIEHDAAAPGAPLPSTEDIVRFVYDSAAAAALLQTARALLDAAPRELSESFEQAVRAAGFAS